MKYRLLGSFYNDKQLADNCELCSVPLEDIFEVVFAENDKVIRKSYCCTNCMEAFLKDNPNNCVFHVRTKV
jgi:hypothetical protein